MKNKTAIVIAFALLSFIALNFIGCGGKTSLTNLSSHELFKLGKEKYNHKKYLRAEEIFQSIVYNYPGETIVDSAQYYLGLSYFGAKEYELAQVEFNRLALNYPSSVYFKHALFMKAVCFFESTPKNYGLDQSELVKAIKQFQDFIIDYPESELIPEAKKYLLIARTRLAKKYYMSGEVYEHMSRYKSAEIYFQEVVDDYTDTQFAPLATFKVGEMTYKQKKYVDAQNKLKNFIDVFPNNQYTPKAKKMIIEASFKSAEQALKKGNYVLAKERLNAFIKNYPNNKKVKKANELIKKIDKITLTNLKENDGNS